MKFLGLIWSNLGRKKLRTSLTLLSIVVAFLLYGFMCAIRQAFLGGVTMAGADRMIVRNNISLIQPLPYSYEARIANVPGVDKVALMVWFNGIYQEPKNVIGSFPTEPEGLLNIYPEIQLAPEQKEAWLQTRNGAVVGVKLMEKYKWKLGDHIPLTSPIWGQPAGQANWDFQIVGVYQTTKKEMDPMGFYFRYDFFDEARVRAKGTIGWYVVRVKDPERTAEIARTIDDMFANSANETKTEAEGAFMTGFAKQFGDVGAITVAVLGAVFFTILLVAGNTMGQAVRERTEELGVLKAVGFSNRLVLGLVLLESLLLTSLGGLAGIGLAWLATVGGSPMPEFLPVFYIPPRDLAVGVGIVLALGVIAGAWPALEASRLRISEALRRG